MHLPGKALKTRVLLCTDQEETAVERLLQLAHCAMHSDTLQKMDKAEDKCMEETVQTRTHSHTLS